MVADDGRSGAFAEAAPVPGLAYLRGYPRPSAAACSLSAVRASGRQAVVAAPLFSLSREAAAFSGVRDAV